MSLTDLWNALQPYLLVLAILLATWLVAWVVRSAVGRLMARSSPAVAAMARRMTWVLAWIVGIVIAIEQLGVRSDILLLMVGLFGVAVLLALRIPIENLAARYFADVYLPFKVGDSIRFDGHEGKVIELNAMATVVLAADESLHSIPNTELMHAPLVNTTPEAWKEVIVPISVGNDVDLAEFESSVLKSCLKLRPHLDERFPPFLSTRARSTQSTDLSLTLMIRSPGERDAIAGEVNKRVADVVASLRRGRPG